MHKKKLKEIKNSSLNKKNNSEKCLKNYKILYLFISQ